MMKKNQQSGTPKRSGVTFFSEGDQFGLFDLSDPAHAAEHRLLVQKTQQQKAELKPSIDQLWAYMLELTDIENIYLSDREKPNHQTPEKLAVYTRYSLQFLCKIMSKKATLLNPDKYRLLEKGKRMFMDDLKRYFTDVASAYEKISDDFKLIKNKLDNINEVPSVRVLTLMIALIVENEKAANYYCDQFKLTLDDLPIGTVLGDVLQLRFSQYTSAKKTCTYDDLLAAAKSGSIDVLRKIQTQGDIDVNQHSGNALYVAAMHGQVQFARLLINDCGAKVTMNHCYAAGVAFKTKGKDTAVELNNLFRTHFTSKYKKEKDVILYQAAANGDIQEVERLIEQGAEVKGQHFFAAGWAFKNKPKESAAIRTILNKALKNTVSAEKNDSPGMK